MLILVVILRGKIPHLKLIYTYRLYSYWYTLTVTAAKQVLLVLKFNFKVLNLLLITN